MAKHEPDTPTDLFRVRPTRQARQEASVGELFQTHDEQAWVLDQLRLLQHWPLDWRTQSELEVDLDFSRVEAGGQQFYELRLHDVRLSHGGNLRVFFWVHEESRTIWIIHGYWKKTQRIAEVVKRRVARRIRNLRGQLQDGSVT